MNFKYLIIYSFITITIPCQLQGQTEENQSSFESFAEELASEMDDELSSEELSEWLNELSISPVQINNNTDQELSRIFWLSPLQISQIKEYVQKYGNIKTIFEIAQIQGFTREDAERMAPYVTFSDPESTDSLAINNADRNPRHWLMLRTQRVKEQQKGFKKPEIPTPTNHFTGDPFRHYLRYNYHQSNTLVGFTAEKDAGEEFYKKSNSLGFDFYSGYWQISNRKHLKTWVIGDYKVSFGQGLAANTAYSPSFASTYSSPAKSARGISKYQSSDENRFFRGSAMTLYFKPFDISLWYSNHRIDGNRVNDTIQPEEYEISSFQNTGIHATSSEIDDEKNIAAEVAGTNVSLNSTNLRMGITAIGYRYSVKINPTEKPYNKFNFRGTENYNLSSDFKYRYRNLLFFGEEALSQSGGIALLNGLESMIHSRLMISIVSRYYERNYQALYGNALGRNTMNSNESGIYAGCRFLPYSNITISALIDIYRFPWLKYGVDMPSDGRDVSLRMNISPMKNLLIDISYRYRQQEQNANGATPNPPTLTFTNNQKIRGNINWKVSERIESQSRVELSRFNTDLLNSKGYYLGQRLQLQMPNIPLKITTQYALFNTDDYNSRIYAYEADMLYTFSIPEFSGQGSRTFIMVQYLLSKKLSFWLKYSTTHYFDRNIVSSGLYEIEGNRKSEVKAQMVIKF